MEIKILGTGCAECKALCQMVIKVVSELGIKATIVKEENMEAIMVYDLIRLPALVIDEKVVASGRLSELQLKELLAGL